jgi:hypothetical protein
MRSEDLGEEPAELSCGCGGGEKEETKLAAPAQEFVSRYRAWECREHD